MSLPPVTDRLSVNFVHLEPCASLQSIYAFQERERERPEPVISPEASVFTLIVGVLPDHAQGKMDSRVGIHIIKSRKALTLLRSDRLILALRLFLGEGLRSDISVGAFILLQAV